MSELLTAVISCIIGIIIGYFLAQKFQLKRSEPKQRVIKQVNDYKTKPPFHPINLPENLGEVNENN